MTDSLSRHLLRTSRRPARRSRRAEDPAIASEVLERLAALESALATLAEAQAITRSS